MVHWALQRAAQAAGDHAEAAAQQRWLATHRGRVFAESTTSEVLRYFNAALAADAQAATSAAATGAVSR